MNLEQLIDEVNKDLDDSLDSGDITAWLNRALDDLTPITRKEAKYSTDISSHVILPEDLFEIAFILADGSEFRNVPIRNNSNSGYKVWGNELTLQNAPESGILEVFYYKRLAHLEDSSDIPEIDPAYHDLLVLYATALSQYAEEEPERQMDAMNRYFNRKREYEAYIQRNSNVIHQVRLVDGVRSEEGEYL